MPPILRAVTLLFFSSLVAFSGFGQNPRVWAAPSLQRIDENQKQLGPNEITIRAARGETESFQVAVTAGGQRLCNVGVSMTPFVKDGDRIGTENVVLYREHYIDNVPRSEDQPAKGDCPRRNSSVLPKDQEVGKFADALIPLEDPQKKGTRLEPNSFVVGPGATQPVWVDVTVPRTAASGIYKATVKVTSKPCTGAALPETRVGEVDAELIVWNFALPVQPALQSAFLMSAPTELLERELLRHRLMPKHVEPDNERAFLDLGLNIASFPCWGGAEATTPQRPMKPAPATSWFSEQAARHTREVPLYCYSADEPNISGEKGSKAWLAQLKEDLKTWGRRMHAAGIRQLVTMKPSRDLYCEEPGDCAVESRHSAVDIWVVLPFQYDEAAAECRHVQMKGDQVWSYNTMLQDHYSPKWLIDYAPVNFRIQPGFINQSLGLTGLLYWRVDYWAEREEPEKAWADARGKTGGPGDGVLVYPGSAVGMAGVAPSMRLKWLRDGVDDYDYVDLLKKAGCTELALSIARRVGPDWCNWSDNPDAVEKARQELGDAIHRRVSGQPCRGG